MQLILSCGVLEVPDYILNKPNNSLCKDRETQRKRFEKFNEFCKQNEFLPTPESLKLFLKLEAHYNSIKGE